MNAGRHTHEAAGWLCEAATTLAARGRYAEAETRLREAFAIDADLPEAHNNLAAVLVKLGRFDEAEGEARRALELRDGYAEAHRHLAEALRRRRKLAEAIQHGQ